MATPLTEMGYRTKAQRLAEFRLLANDLGLSATQRNTLQKTLISVCADLEDCVKVRAALVSKSYDFSRVHRNAIYARSEKQKAKAKK